MRAYIRVSCIIAAVTVWSSGPASGQAAYRQSQELAKEIALTRKAGLPVTTADLQWRLPTASRNAAPIYQQAWNLKARIPAADMRAIGELPSRTAPSAALAASARRIIEAHRDLTALYVRAAQKPVCVFARDWSKGPGLLFPEYAKFREAARWLSATAYVQLADGHAAAAVRTQALGFRVAAHAAADPNLIAYLVGAAIDAITLNGLERILYASGRNPAVCDAIASAVAARPRISLAHAMPGEVVMGMVGVGEVRKGGMASLKQLSGETGGGSPNAGIGARKPANWDHLIDSNAIYLLRAYRRAHASLARPYPQAQPALRQLSAQVERDGKQRDLAAMLAAIMLPVYENLPARAAQVEARSASIRAAAAVLAWKDRHGAFPNRLTNALAPPSDPFDGKPLRYRREESGFVVYSVGASGRFDGGKPTVKPGPRESLFRYPLPAYLR